MIKTTYRKIIRTPDAIRLLAQCKPTMAMRLTLANMSRAVDDALDIFQRGKALLDSEYYGDPDQAGNRKIKDIKLLPLLQEKTVELFSQECEVEVGHIKASVFFGNFEIMPEPTEIAALSWLLTMDMQGIAEEK